jgi:hypothetical protein
VGAGPAVAVLDSRFARSRRRARGPTLVPGRAVVAEVTAQSGGGDLGPPGIGPAHPRQLVADGVRRHHDRQLRFPGHPVRIDGPAVARGGCHHPCSRRRGPPSASEWSCHRGHLVGDVGRAGPAAGLTLHLSVLPARRGALRPLLRRWLVPHWRCCRRDSDGYFWFVGRRRRCDRVRRAPHRAILKSRVP